MGKSLLRMPSMINRPSPGRAKTVSTTNVPARSCPNCRPKIVTTGISAFFSACLPITAHSASPFARAVVTYSCRSTSSMLERVSLARMAAALRPRVIAGSTRCCRSKPPVAGNSLRRSDTRKISSNPSQKLGIDTPSNNTSSDTPSSTGIVAATRRAIYAFTSFSPGTRGTSCPGRRLFDRQLRDERVGVAREFETSNVGPQGEDRQLVDQWHDQRLIHQLLLQLQIQLLAFGRVRFAASLVEHLVDLGVLDARPVEVAADVCRPERGIQHVQLARAQEQLHTVIGAVVVVLVPRRSSLGLDLDIHADLP